MCSSRAAQPVRMERRAESRCSRCCHCASAELLHCCAWEEPTAFPKYHPGHNPTLRLHQEQDNKLRGLFKGKPTAPAPGEALNTSDSALSFLCSTGRRPEGKGCFSGKQGDTSCAGSCCATPWLPQAVKRSAPSHSDPGYLAQSIHQGAAGHNSLNPSPLAQPLS